MFDYDNIKELSPKVVMVLQALAPLAEQAEEAEKQIRATYLFHIGEDKIEVWCDEHNHEYLTHDGVWQARYLHQAYDVKCDAETIFEYLKAEYLIQKGYALETRLGEYTPEGKKATIVRYFRRFIHKTAEEYKKANFEK